WLFFFSSRRRHTRWPRDWSSDVCSSDLVDATEVVQTDGTFGNASPDLGGTQHHARRALGPVLARGVVPVVPGFLGAAPDGQVATDRKSTRLNSSHVAISYAVFCLKKKKNKKNRN